MIGLIAALVAAPLLAAAPPQFVVPPNLPPATVGTKYTYYFCKPIAATRNGVCGSMRTPSTNPVGGGGPPYIFSLKRGAGFPPNGLALSNRTGVLTGTVRAGTAARIHRFSVCVSSARAEGVICRPTALRVDAAPVPEPSFVGTWSGTYTRTFFASGTGRCGELRVQGKPAEVEIRKAGGSYTAHFNLPPAGFSVNNSCQVIERDPAGGFAVTMAPATATTLTGTSSDRVDWSLTLQGADAIAGTGIHEFHRIELTLSKRS